MHDTNGDGKLDYGEFAHAIVKSMRCHAPGQIAFDQNVLVLVSRVRKKKNWTGAPLPLGVSMEAMARDALITALGSVPEAMKLMRPLARASDGDLRQGTTPEASLSDAAN